MRVRITSTPTAGTLLNNGLPVQAGQEISLNNLSLTYQPPTNVNTTSGTLAGATIGFQVIDDGSLANGGQNVDPTVRTFNFSVTPVNDPPRGTDKTVALTENNTLHPSSYPFASNGSDWGFTDPADLNPPSSVTPAPNGLKTVVLQALPQHGTLQINGSNATAGNSITFVGGVAQQTLTYTPSADYSGSDSFTFKVQDDGLTANGGNDLAVNANTFSFNVAAVSDPPTTGQRHQRQHGLRERQRRDHAVQLRLLASRLPVQRSARSGAQ